MELTIQIATLAVAIAALAIEIKRELRQRNPPPEIESPDEEL